MPGVCNPSIMHQLTYDVIHPGHDKGMEQAARPGDPHKRRDSVQRTTEPPTFNYSLILYNSTNLFYIISICWTFHCTSTYLNLSYNWEEATSGRADFNS